MMDDTEHEVLTFMSFPKAHRVQMHSANPLERLDTGVEEVQSAPNSSAQPTQVELCARVGAITHNLWPHSVDFRRGLLFLASL
jgi:hypothetical protein